MTIFPQPQAFPEGAKFVDGVWAQVLSPFAQGTNRPALFLDRDGVLVEEAHYLHKIEDVKLTPNAASVIKAANTQNIPVILVTNQAGIGYGYFGWDDFIAVQARILECLDRDGAYINGVFACPFHGKGQGVYAQEDHPARKPNPGLLILAQEMMDITLAKSWIVGDRSLDLLAGRNAGLVGGIHVQTGHGSKDGEQQAALDVGTQHFSTQSVLNLSQALPKIPLLNNA